MKLSSTGATKLVNTAIPAITKNRLPDSTLQIDQADLQKRLSEPSRPIILPALCATGVGLVAAAGGVVGGGLCGGVLGAGLGAAYFGSNAISVGVAAGGTLGAIGLGTAYGSCVFRAIRGEDRMSEQGNNLGEALARSMFTGAGLGVLGGTTGAMAGCLVGLVTSAVGFDSSAAMATGASVGASLGTVGGVATGFLMNLDYWQQVSN